MKCRILFNLLGAGLVTLAAGSVSATAMPPYALDTPLFSANLANSGDQTETDALNNWLDSVPTNSKYAGLNAIFDYKIDVTGMVPFPAVSNGAAGQWYLNVDPDVPGFFLLKFGTGKSGLDDTYFFENIADLTKLVWSNEQVNYLTGGDCGLNNQSACNIGRLSHYTLFDDPVDSVPEPGSLALLGLGLTAVSMMRRRRP